VSRNATILLIEEHPIVAEWIRNFIATKKPLCKVLTVEHHEQALARLRQEPVHLVITNLESNAPQDSFAFLAVLNGWNPPIPIIAMSDTTLDDLPTLGGGVTVMHKPVDFEILLELIDTMTLAAQESVLNGISLENFLQMIEQEHKTCTLRIVSGYQIGSLFIRDGRLIEAKTGALTKKAAALAILAWPNCTISISERCPVEPTMNLSIHNLLVEWCIVRDESVRAQSPMETA
jgi:response regulator RpfG family c-di-GMP phosphodiesterase